MIMISSNSNGIVSNNSIQYTQTLDISNKVDLTIDDDDEDDIIVVKSTVESDLDEPKSTYLNKDLFQYYYHTEDSSGNIRSQHFPVMQIRSDDRQCSVNCRTCGQNFANYIYIRHLGDHLDLEFGILDALIFPKANEVDCSFLNDFRRSRSSTLLRCEICLIEFGSAVELAQHHQVKHVHSDMPYVCRICHQFRSSFHSRLMQHYRTAHAGSNQLLCPLCTAVFSLQPVAEDPLTLDPCPLLQHMDRHSCRKQFPCDKCALRFISKHALMFHRTVDHIGLHVGHSGSSSTAATPFAIPTPVAALTEKGSSANTVAPGAGGGSGSQTGGSNSASAQKKSLNVGDQLVDISRLTVRSFSISQVCVECREQVHSTVLGKHFQRLLSCDKCGHHTRCSNQARRHKTRCIPTAIQGKLQPQVSVADIWRGGHYLMCACGFSTLHGDLMAHHLHRCHTGERTCHLRSRIQCPSPTCYTPDKPSLLQRHLDALHLHKRGEP